MATWQMGCRTRFWVTIASLLAPSTTAGQEVSLLRDSVQLKLFANFSAFGIVSTDRPFTDGDPLFLLPESPFGFRTNTFDLHARQSSFGLVFTGPKIKGLTTGATLLAFIQNELAADAYGLLPFLAYGELRNEKWRFAAGLNLDIFNPLYPSILPIAILYGSGNTGAYRGQARLERYFAPSEKAHYTIQFGVGNPVGSVVTDNRRVLEDNGWPNVELRLSGQFGAVEEKTGNRKLASFQLGLSAIVGQLRTTGIITVPGEVDDPDRRVVDVHGLGLDAQLALTNRFGLIGEVYAGDGLGEYSGGVLQAFNSVTSEVINSLGAWAEVYYYASNRVHLHAGYGFDNPDDDDLAPFQIRRNQTAYGTLFWDLSRIFQLSFEVDWRETNYFLPLRDANGWLFMSQVLWKL